VGLIAELSRVGGKEDLAWLAIGPAGVPFRVSRIGIFDEEIRRRAYFG